MKTKLLISCFLIWKTNCYEAKSAIIIMLQNTGHKNILLNYILGPKSFEDNKKPKCFLNLNYTFRSSNTSHLNFLKSLLILKN